VLHVLTGLVLVQADLECFVVNEAVHVRREMVQDLEGEVSEGLLRPLDPLAGVGLGKRHSQVLSHGLHLAIILRLGDVNFGCFGERIQVFDAFAEIGVVDARFEAELVLQRDGESIEKVESSAVIRPSVLGSRHDTVG
jgi:hypothetical protein